MKLPNADKLVVEREKIADYLLNPVHPDNGGKAEFFTQHGFHREHCEMLAAALKTLAVESEVAIVSESSHGKLPMVQSIWIVDNNRDTARLVTAYPRKP